MVHTISHNMPYCVLNNHNENQQLNRVRQLDVTQFLCLSVKYEAG